jgi:glutamate dehydrogenase
VVGSEFRAFHVRFREIARGGVRIVKSANPQQYVHNVGSLFDEVFSLSLTQQRKNKDIPEGGSKAVIFLSLRHQDKSQVAFRKFVDALLDLLIPNEAIVNLHGKPVMLFLGPDENTAGFMDWAARHARRRGYTSLWKSFTTGKSPALGGIPHDVYGMTSLGVREYIVGALAAKGWDESQVTSFQTGGPDGDLGSNNLKLGQSRTVAIVDASGVLYHPDGLDSDELRRLAAGRQTCSHFSPALLGATGFFVGTDARDIALPDGTVVENGLFFRDNFQFSDYCRADLFVPCGGRPEAVSQTNVARVFGADGKPRWKVIVEVCVRVAPSASFCVSNFSWIFVSTFSCSFPKTGRQPFLLERREARARARRRRLVSRPGGKQGRGDVLVARGAGRVGADRRAVRGAHAGRGRASAAPILPGLCRCRPGHDPSSVPQRVLVH